MPFRSAHGAAKAHGQTLVFESTAVDELPAAPVPTPIERDARTGRVTRAGAARMAKLRKHRTTIAGPAIACEPGFERFNEQRRRLFRRELTSMQARYGELSPGVISILRGWAWLTTIGEYFCTRGAETGNTKLFESGALKSTQASIEYAKAIELAARDHAARPNVWPSAFEVFGRQVFDSSDAAVTEPTAAPAIPVE